MTYSDNNPERRNLVLLSAAVITYFIGGGAVDGSVLKLPLVNIRFEQIGALQLLVFVVLTWFALRHRQVNGQFAQSEVHKDLQEKQLSLWYRLYAWRRAKLSWAKVRHGRPGGLIIHPQGWDIQWLQPGFIASDQDGNEEPSSKTHCVNLPVDGLTGLAFKIGVYSFSAWNQPTIASYFMPYILFWLAIGLGVESWMGAGHSS